MPQTKAQSKSGRVQRHSVERVVRLSYSELRLLYAEMVGNCANCDDDKLQAEYEVLSRKFLKAIRASEANTAVSQSATSADPLKPSRQSGG
jgi:hypothetical protein